jgi:hypothetical protein
MERRPTAILAAEIACYSRFMEAARTELLLARERIIPISAQPFRRSLWYYRE